ncbi:MAG: type IV secretion system DNA-binding domain-containing protein [Oscillospiraceae bacterium]|nr:type IV secretion system DNA-binding domain-containing protein [Oscillospiraceae bacterium]
MAKKETIRQVTANTALQASITPMGLEFRRNDVILGENLSRIYAIVKYPNEVDYGWYGRLTNIPGTVVSIGYTPLDNGEFIANLSRTINTYRGIADSTKDPLEKQRKNKSADDAERIMQQIDQSNEVVGDFCTLIMVLSRDETDFKEKCNRVESITNTIGCKVRILSGQQKEAYQHICPTYQCVKSIAEIANRPYLISTFIGGFPFSSSGFCDETGFYLGKNANGGIILFDPWQKDVRGNSNITIIGASGMGKSTALKHIMMSEYARGTKIIVIDPESEFWEICKHKDINGEWIDVAGGRGGMINPLEVRPAPRDDKDEEQKDGNLDSIGDLEMHLKTLEVFFKLYIPSLTDRHVAVLNKSLLRMYNNMGFEMGTDLSKKRSEEYPVMSDLLETVKREKATAKAHADIYDDLELLLESAANGADKGLWNGHTTLSGKSNFICLDTMRVVQMGRNITSAQYFNVLSWCWEQMSRDRNERVMLVADECWLMIDPSCPQSLEFLRNAEKRARKYEASVVVSSQNIIDFLDPAVKRCGQEIIDMPSTKIIFGFDGKSFEEVVDIFNLNKAQSDLISSKRKGTALMRVGAQSIRIDFRFSDGRLKSFGKGGGK